MNRNKHVFSLAVASSALLALATLASAEKPDKTAAGSDKPANIERTIDVSKYVRPFPELVAYRNTSIQKAPAPVLAEVCEEQFGKAKVTRCWLNLDEMWDYRTRKYTFNYPIGVHKYDGIREKHGETWGGVKETRLRFDDDYLKAFGAHSDEMMLCIRRYERDVLDKKLGVTMDDWRTIFKTAVKHSKQVCPNLRYIEVCNEYALKGFIGCTADEYYEFYRQAYQAVNEVNAELNLVGNDRLLVGGPNVTGDIIGKMNRFFENYRKDPSPEKKLDFVSWHEYNKKYADTAHREKQVDEMLAAHGLPTGLPMFVTEHDPYHPKAGAREYNLINGAGLVKSLYFTNRYSPNVHIMPWVVYHIGQIQTRFMWFEGPNEPDTKADELTMLPAGCSMRFLSMHKDWEIEVDNDVAADEIVLASVAHDGLVIETVNYGAPRDVSVKLEKLPAVFTASGDGKVKIVTYLIDEEHSNAVAKPDYPGGIEKIGQCEVQPVDGTITLEHSKLAKNGLVLWVVTPEKTGTELPAP